MHSNQPSEGQRVSASLKACTHEAAERDLPTAAHKQTVVAQEAIRSLVFNGKSDYSCVSLLHAMQGAVNAESAHHALEQRLP